MPRTPINRKFWRATKYTLHNYKGKYETLQCILASDPQEWWTTMTQKWLKGTTDIPEVLDEDAKRWKEALIEETSLTGRSDSSHRKHLVELGHCFL